MEEYLADKKITLNILWNKQLALPEEVPLPVLTSTNTVDKQNLWKKSQTHKSTIVILYKISHPKNYRYIDYQFDV